jgi:ABC-type transport system involved in multi-copper enzyme maturation permease subunit
MFDLRLIRAEILKLRRRRGLMIATVALTFAVAVVFYAVVSLLHVAKSGTYPGAGGTGAFEALMALLALSGAVAGTIVGATAGGADIEAGVFRDLAATERSRTALFAVRVPGAWAIVVPPALAALALSTVLAFVLHGEAAPSASTIAEGYASVLVATMLLSAASVGLAALSGSRGMVIGIVLAFQLGLSPILAQIGAIGDARYAIPSVANARIGGDITDELALGVAIAIVLAWAAVTLGAGLWRTRTQEI